MSEETFHLEILTPTKPILDRVVTSAEFQTTRGLMEVRQGHAALVAVLDIGKVTIGEESGSSFSVAVHGGILKIEKDKVMVLASEGELPESIDLDRAKEALEKASVPREEIDAEDVGAMARAKLRAETRIEVFQAHKENR